MQDSDLRQQSRWRVEKEKSKSDLINKSLDDWADYFITNSNLLDSLKPRNI